MIITCLNPENDKVWLEEEGPVWVEGGSLFNCISEYFRAHKRPARKFYLSFTQQEQRRLIGFLKKDKAAVKLKDLKWFAEIIATANLKDLFASVEVVWREDRNSSEKRIAFCVDERPE